MDDKFLIDDVKTTEFRNMSKDYLREKNFVNYMGDTISVLAATTDEKLKTDIWLDFVKTTAQNLLHPNYMDSRVDEFLEELKQQTLEKGWINSTIASAAASSTTTPSMAAGTSLLVGEVTTGAVGSIMTSEEVLQMQATKEAKLRETLQVLPRKPYAGSLFNYHFDQNELFIEQGISMIEERELLIMKNGISLTHAPKTIAEDGEGENHYVVMSKSDYLQTMTLGKLKCQREVYKPTNYHYAPHEALRHYMSLQDSNYEKVSEDYVLMHVRTIDEKMKLAARHFNRHYGEYNDYFNKDYEMNLTESKSITVWKVTNDCLKQLRDYYTENEELHRDYTRVVHTREMTSRAAWDGCMTYQPLKLLWHYSRNINFKELMKTTHDFETVYDYFTTEVVEALKHEVTKLSEVDYNSHRAAFGRALLAGYDVYLKSGNLSGIAEQSRL